MKRGSSSLYRSAVIASLFLAGVIAVSAACSNQGEGERCDVLNGDDDCKTDDGLICYRAADLNNSNSDRCCPRDRSRATNPVCKTPLSTVTNDAQAPTDSGPTPVIPDSSTPDATDDASQDDGGGIVDAANDG